VNTVSVPYRALLPERLDGVVVGGRHVASDAVNELREELRRQGTFVHEPLAASAPRTTQSQLV
jgi:hypothetical protein